MQLWPIANYHLPIASYAFDAASTGAVSTAIPGPMDEEMYEPLMYLPLAAAGLALITLAITVVALSTSFSGVKEILPTGTWTRAVLSVRNSTLPALISFTALAISVVTVPAFGFAIRPRCPSPLPSLLTDLIMSGVAMTAQWSVPFYFWSFPTV